MDLILKTNGIYKKFKGQMAVNKVSLNIPRNSVYGLLGPNGAGKSTTLKMLTGILKPTFGTVTFNGQPWSREALNEIGALIEMPPLYENLTARENLKVRTTLLGLPDDLLIRAVVNIVSNAAERTPPGGQVALSVSEENRVFMVTITDTGSGFSPEALKHGTEQFYMDDTSRTSKTHFGIGLYAADSIIKKHGGQLILDNSKETGGAKVTIKIPS